MSEPQDAPAAAGESGAATPATARNRDVAIALASALLVIIALVATAPLWAPSLPWSAGPARNDAALDARLDRIEGALEQSRQQTRPAEAAANVALQRLDQRVRGLEARPTTPAGDIAEIRRQVANLTSTTADLAARVEAIDKAVKSQPAGDPTDIASVLALLQIRDAVAAGRPFAAAYEALIALARARPEIAAAAAPLAEPARTGVAGRTVLANGLRELAGAIATATEPPANPPATTTAAPDWAEQALSRLRGLVTIRRIDNTGQGQPAGSAEAAVKAAERALAGGDLEGAVGALGELTGAPGGAAGPWLRMAKERLAAEAALQQIEALVVARLGAPASAPAGLGPAR